MFSVKPSSPQSCGVSLKCNLIYCKFLHGYSKTMHMLPSKLCR